jgi:hypothetical protein
MCMCVLECDLYVGRYWQVLCTACVLVCVLDYTAVSYYCVNFIGTRLG